MFRNYHLAEDIASAAYLSWYAHGCHETRFAKNLVVDGVRDLFGRTGTKWSKTKADLEASIVFVDAVPDEASYEVDYTGGVEVRRILPAMREILTQEEVTALLRFMGSRNTTPQNGAVNMRAVRRRKSGLMKLSPYIGIRH